MIASKQKILIIGATHGNELLGTRFYSYLLRTRSELLESIDFIIGNPRAYSKRLRYVESDLNRSYNNGVKSYEERRASEICDYIKKTKPDIVLDMHTTNCVQPDTLIVSGIGGKVRQEVLRASYIDTVLIVDSLHDVASTGENVIGYEIPNTRINVSTFERISADLQRILNREIYSDRKKIYRITGKIYKKDVTTNQAKTFINFENNPLGFIPIMTGNNSYRKQTDYLGFKASTVEEITL